MQRRRNRSGGLFVCFHLHFELAFIIAFCNGVHARMAALTLMRCGSQWVFDNCFNSMQSGRFEVKTKFAWTGKSPWIMSEADNPTMAGELVRQLTTGSVATMTPLDIKYKEEYLPHLKVQTSY